MYGEYAPQGCIYVDTNHRFAAGESIRQAVH